MKFSKKHLSYLLLLSSALLYGYFGYCLDRSDFYMLLGGYLFLFLGFLNLMKQDYFSLGQLTAIAVGFRLIFLFSLPLLSQDFYRFIWDGRLWLNGISPYSFTPNEVMREFPHLVQQGDALIRGMQSLSAGHYSNYPPVSQWVYVLAAKVAPNSILGAAVVMRVVLIFADVGILFFGKKILQMLHMNPKAIFWLLLNPLIILELTGNLHFEGLMLFFVLVSIFLLFQQKWIASALFFGLSIATKLLPLVLLPLLYPVFKRHQKSRFMLSKKAILSFSGFALLSCFIFILSFWGLAEGDFIAHFSESIGLWFGTFEFNASFYYLFRWVGYQWVGWNIIATLGKILPVLILLFILYLAFFRPTPNQKRLMENLLFAAMFYFLFSTTVHPWYLATPLLLSGFTRFRFTVLWSLMVMLSYAAYQHENYQENLWLVTVEYVLVLGYLFYELFFLAKKKDFRLK